MRVPLQLKLAAGKKKTAKVRYASSVKGRKGEGKKKQTKRRETRRVIFSRKRRKERPWRGEVAKQLSPALSLKKGRCTM